MQARAASCRVDDTWFVPTKYAAISPFHAGTCSVLVSGPFGCQVAANRIATFPVNLDVFEFSIVCSLCSCIVALFCTQARTKASSQYGFLPADLETLTWPAIQAGGYVAIGAFAAKAGGSDAPADRSSSEMTDAGDTEEVPVAFLVAQPSRLADTQVRRPLMVVGWFRCIPLLDLPVALFLSSSLPSRAGWQTCVCDNC